MRKKLPAKFHLTAQQLRDAISQYLERSGLVNMPAAKVRVELTFSADGADVVLRPPMD